MSDKKYLESLDTYDLLYYYFKIKFNEALKNQLHIIKKELFNNLYHELSIAFSKSSCNENDMREKVINMIIKEM